VTSDHRSLHVSHFVDIHVRGCAQVVHSNVYNIDASITLNPLGLSVMAKVSAVTRSPLRAMLVTEKPCITYPIMANMAQMYSARFWLDESTRNPKNARLAVLTSLTTSEPSVLGIQQNSEVAVIRYSRLNTVCGGYGASYIELRRYAPLQSVKG
jgi:hypothetical protein